jgi:hypothetical protein
VPFQRDLDVKSLLAIMATPEDGSLGTIAD